MAQRFWGAVCDFAWIGIRAVSCWELCVSEPVTSGVGTTVSVLGACGWDAEAGRMGSTVSEADSPVHFI